MKLNERQLKLYNYLLEQKGWKKRIDILRDLREYYDYIDAGSLYFDSSAMNLTKDIQEINNSYEVKMIIVSNSRKGIKIASKGEAYRYLESERISIMKRFHKYYVLQRKFLKNGQLFANDNYDDEDLEETTSFMED